MDSVEWSRCMANIFFAHGDPQGELQKFRHQVPPFVLRTFCNSSDQNVWVVYDQNQIPTCVGESETLIIYKPETREFEKRHWTKCFGAENIYGRFFDNLTTQTWMREGFRKFDVLKRVDREILNGLVDPTWQIQSLQPSGTISLRRDDVYSLRKFLFLMTSLHSRDRTMHLLAHATQMEDARIRRKRFIEAHSMEHPRDVWLNNAEHILNTQHYDVHNNLQIFDLDREDYRANARERFLVFWEAGPGDEFILTENGFGGFEGGQIGAKQNITINMSSRELEQHMYTRDFMWHQLYVLSPTLVAALCHGTLMHPELTRAQRKRWGLRRSLLENLPHEVAPKYYKDMAKQDALFLKPGWTLPSDVERAFGTNVVFEKRKADELEFPVQRLSPKQVAMVNSVLLHNQQSGAVVKSVCCRSPPQYQSLFNSLVQFHQNPWDKYSDEEQNDYVPLTDRLRVFLQSQATPEPLAAHLQYAQQMQQAQQFSHQLPSHQLHQIPMPMQQQPMPMQQQPMQQMPDPRRLFAADRSMTMPEVPRYEPIHVDMRPSHLRANSQMSHSSHTSSFTPSSQSSQTYSSASSQTSSSRATSIDTPRFEPKALAREPRSNHQSPTRKNERNEKPLSQRNGNSQTESVPSRASDGSGKSKVEKVRPEKQPQAPNIVIEHTVQEIQERHRGRQPARTEQPAPQKVSPQPAPDRVELMVSKPKPRQPEQVKAQQPKPQPQPQQPSVLPERPMYVMDVMDPMRPVQPERQRNDQPQQQWGFNQVEFQGHKYEMGLPEQLVHSQQPQRSASQSNERQSQSSEHLRQCQYEVVMQDQQSHPQPADRNSQTSETARRQQYENPRPELGQIQRPIPPTDRHSADTASSRGRPYEPPRPEQGQIQRPVQRSNERQQQQQQPVADSGRVHQYEVKTEQQSQPMRNTNSHDRSSHGSEHVRQRQYEFEMLKPDQPKPPQVPVHKSQPQIQKPQAQRPVNPTNEAPVVAVEEPRGRQYEIITPEGLQPQPQRSANSSSERQMRPGVEIVRPHALEPVRPEPRSNLQPPSQKPATQTQPERPQYTNGVMENVKVKQLRFDAKTLTRKLSNLSLDGSMIVQTGDNDESEDDDGETTEGEEDDDDDDESWEDEGFAESEELSKPKKPHVRFADRPLSRTGGRVPVHIERPLSRLGLHLGRKVDFIERPSSRLGRRVEIVRPLSRNSQRLGVAGKVKHAHGHGNAHTHR